MKFGVREITDIVFKATSDNQKLGTKTYNQYDPILFFDSAKTSTLESSVATVYAQGGRGNPRLLAWDGDKVATFTFEDALISPASFAALSGADLTNSSATKIHLTEKVTLASATAINTLTVPYGSFNGNADLKDKTKGYINVMQIDQVSGEIIRYFSLASATIGGTDTTLTISGMGSLSAILDENDVERVSAPKAGDIVLVDFYIEQPSKKLEISAEKFAGYYYLEANTLFRGLDGKDRPAQFTIPKAKIESNFTFTMSPTGDPSSFSFKLDAFPAATRFGTKKVLFSLEISESTSDVI